VPRAYKSLVVQSMHYFSRPHEAVAREPLDSPAAWKGSELDEQTWRSELEPDDIREIERAIAAAHALERPLSQLSRRDFPLPGLARRISAWQRTLAEGRGFVVIGGVPVERWPRVDVELFYWCLGQHLGVPGAQNPQGDLLGHVIDTGAQLDDPSVRAYRTAQNIAYHCDAADVVGLLCLQRAKRGGLSRIASSVSVYNEILRRRPDLIDLLYEPFLLDTHGEGGVDFFPIRPCRYYDGSLYTFYHADYFRSVHLHAKVPPLSPAQRELLDLYDGIASSPELRLDMDFRAGDIQLLSNHVVVHARTAYEDHLEPDKKRHLLRLWLSLPARRSLHYRLLKGASAAGIATRLVTLKARRVLMLQ
jgi:hypothetical protein